MDKYETALGVAMSPLRRRLVEPAASSQRRAETVAAPSLFAESRDRSAHHFEGDGIEKNATPLTDLEKKVARSCGMTADEFAAEKQKYADKIDGFAVAGSAASRIGSPNRVRK